MGVKLEVSSKESIAAAKEINAMEIDMQDEEGNTYVHHINPIAKATCILALFVMDGCDAVDEEELSDAMVEYYNKLPARKLLEEMVDEYTKSKGSKPAKEKKEKKEKKTREPKEKKEKPQIEKSRYGHMVGKLSGKLDDALFEGGTMQEIMESVGVNRTRFKGHAKHLRDDLGLTLVIKADPDGNTILDHYSVKEERI